MELNKFKEFLEEKKLDTGQIDIAVDIITEFGQFLAEHDKSLENIAYEDLHSFSAYLIANKKNSFDNYLGLLRYGYFTKNNQLIIAAMELIDGSEVMTNFSKRLIAEFGEEARNEIFGDIEGPPLGLHPSKRPAITKQLIKAFLAKYNRERCEEFLAEGLRDNYWAESSEREKFQKAANIDEFLKNKRQDFIKRLENHLQEETLFFTQEITKDVIDYVKNHPTIESGVREGNRVIITKIPYMTKEYLKEADEDKKRYWYCHCPWVREALKEEKQPVDPIFCNCSGGYYKNYWETALGQPVKVEVIESVLKGDSVCKFALLLPPEVAGH
ncbi:MAG: hypothetical protein ACFFGZ_10690 [Candidatus Thorarchaeota archaeon]